jgi:hypothetical protein
VITTNFTTPERVAKVGRNMKARLTVLSARSEMVPTFVAPTYTATAPHVGQRVAIIPTRLTFNEVDVARLALIVDVDV